MNPHDRLAADHQALRKQAEGLRAAVKNNVSTLADDLVRFQKTVQKHFKCEDVYYRILDDGKRIPDRGLLHQLRNDHAAVVFTLESLAIRLRKHGVNPDWLMRFNNLMNVFIPHLDQEEKSLFPLGQTLLSSEEIDAIADQIKRGE